MAWASELTGYVALTALAASLWVRVAAARFGASDPVASALARRLGIASGAMAVVHGGVGVLGYLHPRSVQEFWEPLTEVVWLRSGALSLATLVALLGLSAVGALRRASQQGGSPTYGSPVRKLRWFAYPALVLAVHHALLTPSSHSRLIAGFAALLAVAWLLRGALHAARRLRSRQAMLDE